MAYLKKIGKYILITFSSAIILGLLLNTLYYFDIINNNIYNIKNNKQKKQRKSMHTLIKSLLD